MTTHEQLLALNEELRRLKADGRRTVSVSEESLATLRATLADEPDDANVDAPAFASAPREPFVPTPPRPREPAFAAGVPVVAPAPVAPNPAAPLPTATFALPEGDKATRWNALREIVLNDKSCKENVHPGKQVVFGVGSLDASIMFV